MTLLGGFIDAANADEGVRFLRELGQRVLRARRVVGYECKHCGAEWDMSAEVLWRTTAPQPVMVRWRQTRPYDPLNHDPGSGRFETTCCGTVVPVKATPRGEPLWETFRPPVRARSVSA